MQTFPRALLEDWMRLYYFDVDSDLGSSGVSDYSLADVRAITGLSIEEMDQIVFRDSQTLGGAGVRQAIADRWTGSDSDRVMVTHGSTEAIFLAMNALLCPGDGVVALGPVYPGLCDVVTGIGCRTREWRLRHEEGWTPDLDRLDALVSNSTRMVVVNFPHNPTGSTLTPGQLDRLLEIVERNGTWLLWDGAFSDLTYETPPLADPSARYERAISLGTLSKGYGLPGLRIGWCIAEPSALDRMIRVRDYTTLHLSPLVELIAARVVAHADRILEEKRTLAAANRELVDRWIDEHAELIRWVKPRGGVCGFPRLPTVDDVDDFCHRLAETHRVMLVPGTCFGTPGHVRLGFGGQTDVLSRGLGSLGTVLREAGVRVAV